jgi:hypothetical protein
MNFVRSPLQKSNQPFLTVPSNSRNLLGFIGLCGVTTSTRNANSASSFSRQRVCTAANIGNAFTRPIGTRLALNKAPWATTPKSFVIISAPTSGFGDFPNIIGVKSKIEIWGIKNEPDIGFRTSAGQEEFPCLIPIDRLPGSASPFLSPRADPEATVPPPQAGTANPAERRQVAQRPVEQRVVRRAIQQAHRGGLRP